MSEQLKVIVSELNKPPFSKGYNLITFDGLKGDQLLQVLNDVFAEVDPKNKFDIREEGIEQTVVRMLNLLKVLKYSPPGGDADANHLRMQLRSGLAIGDKHVIYPILHWLLERVHELKKRAYLARYLVKVDVPGEFIEGDLGDLYSQYDQMIEMFKTLHREREQMQSGGHTTEELRKDITQMEQEKEQLIKRVEKLRTKVESNPRSAPMLEVARELRQERDREQSVSNQKVEQRNNVNFTHNRISRLKQQIESMRRSANQLTPEIMIRKLDESVRTNTYLVNEKLRNDVKSKKAVCEDLERVSGEAGLSQADLKKLQEKIREVNNEASRLTEKKMMSGGESPEDKLSMFRQQAAIVVRKKEATAEKLAELRADLQTLEADVGEKRTTLGVSGGEILRDDDLKRYANKLRSKNASYKKLRQEFANLEEETRVLQHTEELLQGRLNYVKQNLATIEAKKGVSGFVDTQDKLEEVSAKKADLDEMKGKTLDNISEMVRVLTLKVNEKRAALQPKIREVRPLRERHQKVNSEFSEKKAAFEKTVAGYESNRAKSEAEARSMRAECSAEESRLFYLHSMKEILSLQQRRIQDEVKLYTSSNTQDKKRSMREEYNRRISEQDALSKTLREQQKDVREKHQSSQDQMRLWRDVQRLMQLKMSSSNQNVVVEPKAIKSSGGNQQRMIFDEDD